MTPPIAVTHDAAALASDLLTRHRRYESRVRVVAEALRHAGRGTLLIADAPRYWTVPPATGDSLGYAIAAVLPGHDRTRLADTIAAVVYRWLATDYGQSVAASIGEAKRRRAAASMTNGAGNDRG